MKINILMGQIIQACAPIYNAKATLSIWCYLRKCPSLGTSTIHELIKISVIR